MLENLEDGNDHDPGIWHQRVRVHWSGTIPHVGRDLSVSIKRKGMTEPNGNGEGEGGIDDSRRWQ